MDPHKKNYLDDQGVYRIGPELKPGTRIVLINDLAWGTCYGTITNVTVEPAHQEDWPGVYPSFVEHFDCILETPEGPKESKGNFTTFDGVHWDLAEVYDTRFERVNFSHVELYVLRAVRDNVDFMGNGVCSNREYKRALYKLATHRMVSGHHPNIKVLPEGVKYLEYKKL